jgi:hypothetical protein
MKKIILTLGIALLATSCIKEAQSKSHEGIDFEVEFLFEKDGIKMYRFYDYGHYHYYTDNGETLTTQKEGKTEYEENIK